MCNGGIGSMTQGERAIRPSRLPKVLSVEIGYPMVVPAVNAAGATIDTFVLQETGTKLYGLVQLVFDTAGDLLGGITRQNYQGLGTGPVDGFNTQIMQFAKNSDGSYAMSTFNNGVNLPKFQPQNHSATMSINGGAPLGYTATEQ